MTAEHIATPTGRDDAFSDAPSHTSDETAPQRRRGQRGQRGGQRGILILGWTGAALLVVLLAVAVFAPYLTPYDPQAAIAIPHQPPSRMHLLGTNDLGQDLFTRLLYGTRLSLTIGILAGLVATSIGLAAGLVAGFYRGWADSVIMRVVDLTLALPFVPLVIVLAAFFGRGLLITVGVIGAVLWARPGRILRAQALKISAYQHVDAARAMGSSSLRTLWRHVLPRTAPLAVAQFVHAANVAVLIEASLSFLGLGDPNRVSWGTMLFFASNNNAMLTRAWKWWILPPGLTLTAAVVGFAFIGVAIEQWGDRRLSGTTLAPAPIGRLAKQLSRARRWRRPATTGATQQHRGALDVSDLRVVYETGSAPVTAVDGVSFSVGHGQIVGLVGESGCGKTTLAMALVGLVPPPGKIHHGSILVGGYDLAEMTEQETARVRGRQVSLVPQSSMNALNPAYQCHRQVAEAAALTRTPHEAARRARELLEMVGLDAGVGKAYPHQLSGGMRQRVVIAMALVNKPKVVIADEPLTGLDVLTQERIIRLLVELQSQLDIAILLVSHDLPLVGHVADELLVMYAGRIVESGPASQVMAQPHHPYTQELLRAFPTLHGPKGQLALLPGTPPDLRHPPSGCRFHPRCPKAFADCTVTQPQLVETAGRRAACLLEQ